MGRTRRKEGGGGDAEAGAEQSKRRERGIERRRAREHVEEGVVRSVSTARARMVHARVCENVACHKGSHAREVSLPEFRLAQRSSRQRKAPACLSPDALTRAVSSCFHMPSIEHQLSVLSSALGYSAFLPQNTAMQSRCKDMSRWEMTAGRCVHPNSGDARESLRRLRQRAIKCPPAASLPRLLCCSDQTHQPPAPPPQIQ
eukprot:3395644-Rhodomonas_salina.3